MNETYKQLPLNKRLEYSATGKSGIKIVKGNFGSAGEVYWSSCMIKILAF